LSPHEGARDRAVETTPALVIALEAERPTAGGERFALGGLDEIEVGRGERRALDRRGARGRITVPDPFLSTVHFTLRRDGDRFLVTDAGSKNGTRIDGVRRATAALDDGAVLEAATTWFVFLPAAPTAARGDTFDPLLADELDRLDRIAATDLSLLIRGETGTGKEVAARAVHDRSGRRGAFVAVNLAAVPSDLLEGHLFGHRRGAFTGATEDRAGLIRAADGGTLFLDEVAELPPAGQAALLRVLQEREVLPLGATAPIAVDVRVIAATHQDLAARIAAGEFRQDLFARLAGHQVSLPPLRRRRVDLGLLIARLLARTGSTAARLSRDAGRALFEHTWPLNVRELDHALRRAVALAGADPIEPAHLGLHAAPPPESAAPAPPPAPTAPPRDRDALVALFASHGGNVAAVARALGTSPSHVRRLVARHKLDLEALRRGETVVDEPGSRD
jgi:transcriptional regulator of acetoin/glycerol metabolism